MRSRQKKTATTGATPSPSEGRQTTRRWLSPNLVNMLDMGLVKLWERHGGTDIQ